MPRGKTGSELCSICDKPVSLFALNRHIKSHSNTNSVAHIVPIQFLPTACMYCAKVYANKSGLSNHSRRCPDNPHRIMESITDNGRMQIIKSGQTRIWDDAMRLRHSESMKRAVDARPESYSSSNRGRTKQIEVDGIKLQGQWEVDFYNWSKNNNLSPERPIQGFAYEWNGIRKYFPDFYIPLLNIYVEVKGYETDRDRAKWQQFTKKLHIVKNEEIKKIRNNLFTVDMLLDLSYTID